MLEGMAQTVSVIVEAEDRARMAAILGDRNRPRKHVQRASIVLPSSRTIEDNSVNDDHELARARQGFRPFD